MHKVAPDADPHAAALQPGSKLVAAGYALYSSATMLVISVGQVSFGRLLGDTLCSSYLWDRQLQMQLHASLHLIGASRHLWHVLSGCHAGHPSGADDADANAKVSEQLQGDSKLRSGAPCCPFVRYAV